MNTGWGALWGGQNGGQNPYNIQADRGLAVFHAAHRLVTSGLYELPFGKGKKFLNQGGIVNTLLGGWQLGSILTLQTGFPTTVFCGALTSNDLLNHCLPNATGQKAALSRGQQDPERFFNTAAYALPPFGSYGNLGRNTLIGPGLINWDFSILKNFRIREGHDLQFRFEAFNVPNHPNWDLPNTIFSSPFFGKIRATRSNMREVQFGLKYIF